MFSSFVQDSIADFSKPGAKLAEVLAPEVGDAVVVPYFDVLPATSYVNDGAFPSTRLSVKWHGWKLKPLDKYYNRRRRPMMF